MNRFFYLIFGVSIFGFFASGIVIAEYRNTIWSIQATQNIKRWIVIHNLEDAAVSGIYHIEVLGRKNGDAVWQIKRLVDHMAITEKALNASIKKPLKRGAVYPETFNNTYTAWQQENGGTGRVICDTSILDCMQTYNRSL